MYLVHQFCPEDVNSNEYLDTVFRCIVFSLDVFTCAFSRTGILYGLYITFATQKRNTPISLIRLDDYHWTVLEEMRLAAGDASGPYHNPHLDMIFNYFAEEKAFLYTVFLDAAVLNAFVVSPYFEPASLTSHMVVRTSSNVDVYAANLEHVIWLRNSIHPAKRHRSKDIGASCSTMKLRTEMGTVAHSSMLYHSSAASLNAEATFQHTERHFHDFQAGGAEDGQADENGNEIGDGGGGDDEDDDDDEYAGMEVPYANIDDSSI
eukprot:ANDGO_06313.mRNA.1 hypothetical protein